MATHDLRRAPTLCPHCAATLSGATNTKDGSHARPEPDSFSVCAYCGTILLFAEDLRLVKATVADLEHFKREDPERAARLALTALGFRLKPWPRPREGKPA